MASEIRGELVRINLLIGSYALSQTPAAMHLEFQDSSAGEKSLREPELAINAAMLCLHRAYRFIESAARLRYKYPSWKEHDPIMCKGQFDEVAQCRSVLDALKTLSARLQSHYLPATSTLRDTETLAEIYAMRTQLRVGYNLPLVCPQPIPDGVR